MSEGRQPLDGSKGALIDLNRLADELRSRRALRALEKRIRRFHGKSVVLADLEAAKRASDALLALIKDHPNPKELTPFHLTAGEALGVQAVIAYCRALVSVGKGRQGTNVKYPPDLREAHKRVASLRDQRLCHYGRSDEAREARWADDRAVLRCDSETLALRFATSRMGWEVAILRDLERLIPFALETVAAQAKSEGQLVLDAFLEAVDDPVFLALRGSCGFDAAKFFASLDQASAMESPQITVFEGVRVGAFEEVPD